MKRRIILLILVFSLIVTPADASTIKWVDFQVPYESLKYALDRDVATFEQAVKTDLLAYLDYNYQIQVENEVLEKMVTGSTFGEIPEWLIEKYKANMMESLNTAAASQGVDADTYCNAYYQMSAEEYVSTYAIEAVKQGLVFQAIANAENLNVTDEELNTKLEEYIAGSAYATVEEFVGDKDIEEYREYFMFEKVLDYLCDLASQNAAK